MFLAHVIWEANCAPLWQQWHSVLLTTEDWPNYPLGWAG